MAKKGKQIQTSLRLISVSLSNVLYCIYDVSVVSRCTLYLNKILFTLMALNSHKNRKILPITSFKTETMGKLIYRIPGSSLLVSGIPSLAMRTHVELLDKPLIVNKHSQSLAWLT